LSPQPFQTSSRIPNKNLADTASPPDKSFNLFGRFLIIAPARPVPARKVFGIFLCINIFQCNQSEREGASRVKLKHKTFAVVLGNGERIFPLSIAPRPSYKHKKMFVTEHAITNCPGRTRDWRARVEAFFSRLDHFPCAQRMREHEKICNCRRIAGIVVAALRNHLENFYCLISGRGSRSIY
jgi:hypothetical protein